MGDRCHFAHGQEELRRATDMLPQGAPYISEARLAASGSGSHSDHMQGPRIPRLTEKGTRLSSKTRPTTPANGPTSTDERSLAAKPSDTAADQLHHRKFGGYAQSELRHAEAALVGSTDRSDAIHEASSRDCSQ